MKNTTLTSLIVRLAGFALFVKIFDFFGSYFMSIYLTASMSILDETLGMSDSFDKLYISGTFLAFANLFLALTLILKSDWIARKMIKTESEIPIEITPRGIMKIVIATIGIIYCARTIYTIPSTINHTYSLIRNWNTPESDYGYLADITNYLIRAVIGIVFVFKAERISKFAIGKKSSL